MKASRTRDKHLALFGQLIRHRHRKIWVKRSRVTPTRHHHENLELVFDQSFGVIEGASRVGQVRPAHVKASRTRDKHLALFGQFIRHRYRKIWVKRSRVTPTRHNHENLELVFWGDRRCSSVRTGTSGTCESISDSRRASCAFQRLAARLGTQDMGQKVSSHTYSTQS